jgi:hypothetical protein
VLIGDASGGYFPGLGRWKTKGDLSYVPVTTGVDPNHVTFQEKDLAWTGAGSFMGLPVTRHGHYTTGRRES